MKRIVFLFSISVLVSPVWGQTPAAAEQPAAPSVQQAQPVPPQGPVAASQTPAAQEPAKQPATEAAATAPAAQPAQEQPAVPAEKPVATAEQKAIEQDLAQADEAAAQPEGEFVAARETVEEEIIAPKETPRVVFAPKSQRDPTLSPDDFLLIQHREQQRLAAIEAERQRKLDEERRKREEAERLRQLELERIKDPTREVRNKIRIGGVIGQEVFIGSKIYTVGNTVYGARIIAVRPDEVVFSYKGHKFVRKVQL